MDYLLDDAWILVKYFCLMAIPAGLLFFHVWNQYSITELGYRISQATEQHRQLLEKNRKLRIEATYLARPNRVTSIAKNAYRFGARQPEQIIEFSSDSPSDSIDLAQNRDRNRKQARR